MSYFRLYMTQVQILVFTYGILFGGGSSLVYTPSLVILGHYFKRHIGLVNGLVATGSSIFTIAMPHILKVLLKEVEVSHSFTSSLGLKYIIFYSVLENKYFIKSLYCLFLDTVDVWNFVWISLRAYVGFSQF